MALNERQYFAVTAKGHLREPLKQRQHFRTPMQRTAGQFTDHKWMAFDFSPDQQGAESSIRLTEVVYPNGSVN